MKKITYEQLEKFIIKRANETCTDDLTKYDSAKFFAYRFGVLEHYFLNLINSPTLERRKMLQEIIAANE